jgi:excisionase family DNA binding protein
MRVQEATLLLDEDSPLLTTGEAALLLGVSRQHIVDLCSSGALPYSMVGSHRRVRRNDVELLAAGARRTTRDQARSLLMAHALAGAIVLNPDRAVELGRRNLARQRAGSSRGAAKLWALEWERLLEAPLIELVSALTSPSPRSRELRQNHPFAGLLTDSERAAVIESSRRGVGRKPSDHQHDSDSEAP